VTHTLQNEQHVQKLAEFDPLTSLGNRRRLDRRIRESMELSDEAGNSTGILYIDLDRFKYINDVYGHSIGDIILGEFSRRMSQSLEDLDSEPFRFGGDEFVILVPGVDSPEQLEEIARNMQELIEIPVGVSEMQFNLGASIGISMYPRDGRDPETLIKHADLAMYEAKSSHHKLCFFEANLANVAADLLQYETMLRESLERDELVAWYQPIIDLSTGETIGAEALARWIHSEHGMIGPQHFIGMAEDTGLIVPLGEQILNQGLRHLKSWKDAGRQMQMNFNVSPRQLQVPGFISALLVKIEDAGLEPGDVVMEITESVLMDNLEGVRSMLIEAREAGLYVALDDFGTGFSSFKYLADLPADMLKLDHTLLRGIEDNERRLRLIRSIVYMTQDLGLTVVAEGIETESLEDLFRGMGPVLGQGYYYSKPLPPETFEEALGLKGTTNSIEAS
jgi:diguanylate cyclase (GGDEF)-like protein